MGKRGPMPRPAIDRLMANVEMLPWCGCWIWMGGLHPSGHGQMRLSVPKRDVEYTHRVAYEHFVGPIPEDKVLDHVKTRGCASKACCNPDHLEPVTAVENTRRGNAPTAVNARKTHCLRGHTLLGESVKVRSDGHRQCRTCRNENRRTATARLHLVVQPKAEE